MTTNWNLTDLPKSKGLWWEFRAGWNRPGKIALIAVLSMFGILAYRPFITRILPDYPSVAVWTLGIHGTIVITILIVCAVWNAHLENKRIDAIYKRTSRFP